MNKIEKYQSTLGGGKLPLKVMPERKLARGSVAWKIYNYIKGCYTPVTESTIQGLPMFEGNTIGNRLRDLRAWGYIKDERRPDGRQVWRAIL